MRFLGCGEDNIEIVNKGRPGAFLTTPHGMKQHTRGDKEIHGIQ